MSETLPCNVCGGSDHIATQHDEIAGRKFTIRIDGEISLEPRYFFDDSPINWHGETTEVDCAREVARYIDAHGLSTWLREWNLDDIDVYVGNYPAVIKGITTTADSNTDSELRGQYHP